jgi:uncharacterized phage protein (TIGR01671 family)
MREIKFRMFVNGKMAQGLPLNDIIAVFCATNRQIPDTVPFMQYTGLKDRRGKEVYEGDVVVQWDNGLEETEKFVVKWFGEDGYFAFDLEPNHFEETNALSFYAQNSEGYEIEVIGNIYENPDLLTQ